MSNTIPSTPKPVTPGQFAYDKFKAIMDATKDNGDLFEVNVDGHHLSGNLYARSMGQGGQQMTLEANVNDGTQATGWQESTQRWEIFSVDGVDNMMNFTQVNQDGAPGIAAEYHGAFFYHPKAQ